MLGAPDSCGVWAPCLTHGDGMFWLIYTDVRRYGCTTVGGGLGGLLARPLQPSPAPRWGSRGKDESVIPN